jgi:hypothetical protein
MPGPVTHTKYDMAIEEHGLRKQGMLGSGRNANTLFSIDYDSLPPQARGTIALIIAGGPFPYPGKDGTAFGNKFGDLPSGTYLEFTVPTPGCTTRGARRIVARKTTGQLFFTACHYERVGGGTAATRTAATAALDEAWRNGFYLVTGMTVELREQVRTAIKTGY